MSENPYLKKIQTSGQTTVYGAVGEGLKGVGLITPPPFNFIFFGLGAISTAYALYLAQDRTKEV